VLGIARASYYRILKTDPKLPRLVKITEGGRAVAADADALEAYRRSRIEAAAAAKPREAA
jgi:hypothetical protein